MVTIGLQNRNQNKLPSKKIFTILVEEDFQSKYRGKVKNANVHTEKEKDYFKMNEKEKEFFIPESISDSTPKRMKTLHERMTKSNNNKKKPNHSETDHGLDQIGKWTTYFDTWMGLNFTVIELFPLDGHTHAPRAALIKLLNNGNLCPCLLCPTYGDLEQISYRLYKKKVVRHSLTDKIQSQSQSQGYPAKFDPRWIYRPADNVGFPVQCLSTKKFSPYTFVKMEEYLSLNSAKSESMEEKQTYLNIPYLNEILARQFIGRKVKLNRNATSIMQNEQEENSLRSKELESGTNTIPVHVHFYDNCTFLHYICFEPLNYAKTVEEEKAPFERNIHLQGNVCESYTADEIGYIPESGCLFDLMSFLGSSGPSQIGYSIKYHIEKKLLAYKRDKPVPIEPFLSKAQGESKDLLGWEFIIYPIDLFFLHLYETNVLFTDGKVYLATIGNSNDGDRMSNCLIGEDQVVKKMYPHCGEGGEVTPEILSTLIPYDIMNNKNRDYSLSDLTVANIEKSAVIVYHSGYSCEDSNTEFNSLENILSVDMFKIAKDRQKKRKFDTTLTPGDNVPPHCTITLPNYSRDAAIYNKSNSERNFAPDFTRIERFLHQVRKIECLISDFSIVNSFQGEDDSGNKSRILFQNNLDHLRNVIGFYESFLLKDYVRDTLVDTHLDADFALEEKRWNSVLNSININLNFLIEQLHKECEEEKKQIEELLLTRKDIMDNLTLIDEKLQGQKQTSQLPSYHSKAYSSDILSLNIVSEVECTEIEKARETAEEMHVDCLRRKALISQIQSFLSVMRIEVQEEVRMLVILEKLRQQALKDVKWYCRCRKTMAFIAPECRRHVVKFSCYESPVRLDQVTYAVESFSNLLSSDSSTFIDDIPFRYTHTRYCQEFRPRFMTAEDAIRLCHTEPYIEAIKEQCQFIQENISFIKKNMFVVARKLLDLDSLESSHNKNSNEKYLNGDTLQNIEAARRQLDEQQRKCAEELQDPNTYVSSLFLPTLGQGRGKYDLKDPDTCICPDTYIASLNAVDCVLKAVDEVMSKRVGNIFCVVRPPGHHVGPSGPALNAAGTGFGIFNSVAIGACYAKAFYGEIKRVCVLDFDVHHGNGTEECFQKAIEKESQDDWGLRGKVMNNTKRTINDKEDQFNYLYCSVHNGIVAYPGTGKKKSPKQQGIENYASDTEILEPAFYHRVFEKLMATIKKFGPDIIFISAGFDAHKCDAMGLGGLSSNDFLISTQKIVAVANEVCDGRIISVLEGGYHTVDVPEKGNNGQNGAHEKAKKDDTNVNNLSLPKPYEGIVECVQGHLEGLLPTSSCICKECQLLQRQKLNSDFESQQTEGPSNIISNCKKIKMDVIKLVDKEMPVHFLDLIKLLHILGIYFKEREQDHFFSRYCFFMKYRMLFRPQDVEWEEVLNLLQLSLESCNSGYSSLPEIYTIQLRQIVAKSDR